ncbi:MAG: hypothetical protein SNJ55_13440 [Chloroherpetonaceae bacterium]
MRIIFAIFVGLLAVNLLTESASAQSKGKARSKSKTAATDKKKSGGGSSDTVLEERTISTKLETPRTKFVVDRMYPDVKVDFGRFGDLSESINGDAQRALYRNKYEEKPEKMSANDIVDRIGK